jgi:hypothetical protein
MNDMSSLPSESILFTICQGHRDKLRSTLDESTARPYHRWSSGDNAKRCSSSGELLASSTELSTCISSHQFEVLITTRVLFPHVCFLFYDVDTWHLMGRFQKENTEFEILSASLDHTSSNQLCFKASFAVSLILGSNTVSPQISVLKSFQSSSSQPRDWFHVQSAKLAQVLLSKAPKSSRRVSNTWSQGLPWR